MPALIIRIQPEAAASIATIQVDNLPIIGNRVELPAARRVHVSITAMGFRRYSQDVDVAATDTAIDVDLAKRPSKHKRTIAVTLGMGALGVLAWLARRR